MKARDLNFRKGNERLYFFERIKKNKEIRTFFDNKEGTRFFNGKMRVYSVIAKKNGFDYFRFAVSIKKSKGSAPLRNKAKRYIRELFRRNKNTIPKGYDYFILINNAESMPFELRTECFLSMFYKVSL